MATIAAADLKVFILSKESKCGDCGHALDRHAWVFLAGERGALCLACADLDHLLLLPTGDAALTRRARKHSALSAIVLAWSRSRKRYERQGVLVEESGLAQAESECLADADARARKREREAERREGLDRRYIEDFAKRVRELFPRCPKGTERRIAEHACSRYSGRVGRSAAAKAMDEAAVRLAVIAHIRHVETPYHRLLAAGHDRQDARDSVRDKVDAVLHEWSAKPENH